MVCRNLWIVALMTSSFLAEHNRGTFAARPTGARHVQGYWAEGTPKSISIFLHTQLSYYADTSPEAQRVSGFRLQRLMARYGGLLRDAPWSHTALPMNIQEWNREVLGHIMAEARNTPVLMLAGWPCQDLSQARGGAGLAGPRSGLFYEVERIIRECKDKSIQGQVRFLTENGPIRFNDKHKKVVEEINGAWGVPVIVDAARFGAGAHRLPYLPV